MCKEERECDELTQVQYGRAKENKTHELTTEITHEFY